MGYYTRYSIKHDEINPAVTDVIDEALEKIWDGYSPFDEECKWYEHEDDMKEFSKRFPNVLFTLSGEGEEAGDIWKKYFKNGKVQVSKARIIVDDFEESELKG